MYSFRITILTAAVGVKYLHHDEFFKMKKLHAASTDIDLSDALVEPITDVNTLKSNSDKMKHKMEVFITNLQGKIIKELQSLESDAKFFVDRWTRPEVK